MQDAGRAGRALGPSAQNPVAYLVVFLELQEIRHDVRDGQGVAAHAVPVDHLAEDLERLRLLLVKLLGRDRQISDLLELPQRLRVQHLHRLVPQALVVGRVAVPRLGVRQREHVRAQQPLRPMLLPRIFIIIVKQCQHLLLPLEVALALVQQVEAVGVVVAGEADDSPGRVGKPLVARVHAQLGVQHTAARG